MTRTIKMTVEYEAAPDALGAVLERHAAGKEGPLAGLIPNTVKMVHARVEENPDWEPLAPVQETWDDEDATNFAALWKETDQKLSRLRTVLETTTRQRDNSDQHVADLTDEAEDQDRKIFHLKKQLYEATATVKEQAALIEALRAEQTRTVEVTDAMVERATHAFNTAPFENSVPQDMRTVLTAALTETPARPEGAVELDELIDAFHAQSVGELADGHSLADFLAERGVRAGGES